MRFTFIDAAKAEFPIQRLCQVLEVSQSGYFAWRSRPACQRQRDDLVLLAHVRSILRKIDSRMIEANEMDDVVSIMGAMPIARRAKIITEFKSPEEVEKLGDVLRLIREGVPQVDLIEKTKDQIKQP